MMKFYVRWSNNKWKKKRKEEEETTHQLIPLISRVSPMQNKGFTHNEVENATTIPAVPYKFIRCHGSETIIQIQMILFQVKIITIIHYRLTYFVLSRITNKLFNKKGGRGEGLTVVTTRIRSYSIYSILTLGEFIY